MKVENTENNRKIQQVAANYGDWGYVYELKIVYKDLSMWLMEKWKTWERKRKQEMACDGADRELDRAVDFCLTF